MAVKPEGALGEGAGVGLLMKHRTALYAYLFACVRSHHDAEDLLQDVSVAVIESIGQLKSEDGFLPWAREIARRRVLASKRSSARLKAVDPEIAQALLDASKRIDLAKPAHAEREALRACLESLDPEGRKLLALRYDVSFTSVKDITRVLGRTEQGIYAAIKRIKEQLRECTERRLNRGATA